MNLEDLGYNDKLKKYITEHNLEDFKAGRVITEHKERYIVKTAEDEYEAEITGNMRFTARGREDFPAVGDWVAITPYESDFAIIHSILPRYSMVKRQAAGNSGEVQVIAVNIDYAFIVQAVDRDFNINRLERYLIICNASHVQPVILLSKTDLIDEFTLNEMLSKIQARIKDVPVFSISNETLNGYDEIKSFIKKGKTYCLMGSSGVGKSTLMNNLLGRVAMKTDKISESTSKGRHVTTHRELVILENGGILIDNPGMREVGIADTSGGLELTFDIITRLAEECKFKDCKHISESGCAVIEAVKNGELDKTTYENYLKLEREKTHYESTVAERRQKDKAFGKILKTYKRDMKRNED